MEEREAQKCCWLKEEEGVFIGGEKSGRWKQPAGQFGRKSGGAGFQTGLFGGQSGASQSGGQSSGAPKNQSEHSFVERRENPVWGRMVRPGAEPGAELGFPKTQITFARKL
jgi:hypothetical protein